MIEATKTDRKTALTGDQSDASPATTGSTPSPIVSAPAAFRPRSKRRPLYRSVEMNHSSDALPRTALTTIATPSASTTRPAQSAFDHDVRQRRAGSARHAADTSERPRIG